ncbi:hypothetical protein DFA_07772 [Cavenderia fasciculata]|uniref:Uncharacterized protein n=1 Tax=Cavenderia fasciculata TaxID=261658 RepID=F4Q372_CACFS|nr:uncharacterized protein DFA_07772 [Cavenderia fasciculata]EGG16794.1 hypothetical protein DFA_07772 [Cavenderia fasciculata]|eukprot:XP_004355268.1 hypothetical protein DFA_07772 [Cavenderia fasciculata]
MIFSIGNSFSWSRTAVMIILSQLFISQCCNGLEYVLIMTFNTSSCTMATVKDFSSIPLDTCFPHEQSISNSFKYTITKSADGSKRPTINQYADNNCTWRSSELVDNDVGIGTCTQSKVDSTIYNNAEIITEANHQAINPFGDRYCYEKYTAPCKVGVPYSKTCFMRGTNVFDRATNEWVSSANKTTNAPPFSGPEMIFGMPLILEYKLFYESSESVPWSSIVFPMDKGCDIVSTNITRFTNLGLRVFLTNYKGLGPAAISKETVYSSWEYYMDQYAYVNPTRTPDLLQDSSIDCRVMGDQVAMWQTADTNKEIFKIDCIIQDDADGADEPRDKDRDNDPCYSESFGGCKRGSSSEYSMSCYAYGYINCSSAYHVKCQAGNNVCEYKHGHLVMPGTNDTHSSKSSLVRPSASSSAVNTNSNLSSSDNHSTTTTTTTTTGVVQLNTTTTSTTTSTATTTTTTTTGESSPPAKRSSSSSQSTASSTTLSSSYFSIIIIAMLAYIFLPILNTLTL